MLHPVWEPTTSGEPASDEWLARCLLGQGWVGGTGKLTMLDLRVWAALCAMLREQLNGEPPSDDPTLDRGASRIVQATGYELADRVLGSEGGRQWRSLRRSLARLRTTTITARIVERDQTLAIETLHEGLVGPRRRDLDRDDTPRPDRAASVGRVEGHGLAAGGAWSVACSAGARRPLYVAGP